MIDDFDESTEAEEEKEKLEAEEQAKEQKVVERKKEEEATTVNKGFYIKPKEKFDFAKIIVFLILGMAIIIASFFIFG